MKRLVVFLAIVLGVMNVNAQPAKTDSLIAAVSSSVTEDTNRVNNLFELCWLLKGKDPVKAIKYGNEALTLARKLNFKKGEIQALQNLGVVYTMKTEFTAGLLHFYRALQIARTHGTPKSLSSLFNNVGIVHMYKSEYDEAIRFYLVALEIREKVLDSVNIATSLNNIGIVYNYKKDYRTALSYQLRALKIKERVADKLQLASTLNNVGLIYLDLNILDSAEIHLSRALSLRKEAGHRSGEAECLLNLGNLYVKKNNYDEALTVYRSSLKIGEELGDGRVISSANRALGKICFDKKDFQAAQKHTLLAITTAREIGDDDALFDAYELHAYVLFALGNYKDAFLYHKKFSDLKDTVLNEENIKQINELEARFENEKKNKALITKEAEINKKNSENRTHVFQRNMFIGGFLLMIALAFFIFKSYRGKKKANLEILKQKHIIEEKQKEILDSIYYARRIQRALITNEKYFEKYLTKLKRSGKSN